MTPDNMIVKDICDLVDKRFSDYFKDKKCVLKPNQQDSTFLHFIRTSVEMYNPTNYYWTLHEDSDLPAEILLFLEEEFKKKGLSFKRFDY
jgi:hypothetical protein